MFTGDISYININSIVLDYTRYTENVVAESENVIQYSIKK
jgi:hypothetical protein